MTLTNIEYILRSLGCTGIKTVGNKVKSSCPFAFFTHGGGRDIHPSFYAFINDDQEKLPGFKCHACSKNGSLVQLLMLLKEYTKEDYMDLYLYIKQNTEVATGTLVKKATAVKSYFGNIKVKAPKLINGKVPAFEYFGTGGYSFNLSDKEPPAKALDESLLAKYIEPLTEQALAYLKGPLRKLTDQTIAVWELGWNRRGYISLPVRDVDGRLVGITGRALDQEQKPKYLHSENFDRNKILYGENKISKGGKCHLAEGHFDVQWLWQNGYSNPLGVMGTFLSLYNVEKLVDWFDEVVIVSDANVAGLKAQKDWYDLLKSRTCVTIARTISGKDPNSLTPTELKNCLGENSSKKNLTSWFEPDKSIRSYSGSLTIEEDVKSMTCVRCHRDLHICATAQGQDKEGQPLEVLVNGNSFVSFNSKEVCDSCINDIERLLNQIKAIPVVEKYL